MRSLDTVWKLLRRPEMAAIFLVVFTADIVAGITYATFSLYAVHLGASLALVGMLSGATGFTSIFASLPIGMVSDIYGRKYLLSTGILLFAITSFMYTIVPAPIFLLPVRILASLGVVSVFMVGIAYVGDMAPRAERGLAVGLYSTAMGFGFAVGPAVGGIIAARYGYAASYHVAAAIGFVGWLVALRGLARRPALTGGAASASQISLWHKVRVMVSSPQLMGASLANLGNHVVFTTIFSFLPLYVTSMGVGEAVLGAMLGGRALASTLARLPTGMLTMYWRSRHLMLAALLIAAAVLYAISRTSSTTLVSGLLMVDGIAYGMFLTAGQAHVTNISVETERGTAVGVYNTAGSVGAALGPVLLGIAAEWLGLASVFQIAAGVVLLAAGVFYVMHLLFDSSAQEKTEYSALP